MPNPRFQIAVGPVNGVNKQFETSEEYTVDTLVVFRNGALLERSADNGWMELGGKQFEMKMVPLTEDVVHCFYMDTLPSEGIAVEVEVERIHGVIESVGEMVGFVEPVQSIFGVAEDAASVIGVVYDHGEILGVVEEQSTMVGFMECG